MSSTASPTLGAGLLPQGAAFDWDSGWVGLNTAADGLLAAAYLTLAITIVYFARTRPGLIFHHAALVMGVILVSGALAHGCAILNLWHASTWASGGARLIAGLISAAAVIAVVRAVPSVLVVPTRTELQRINATLEERVAARTAALTATNEQLRAEAGERSRAEEEVRRLNAELQARLAEFESLFNLLPFGVAISTDPGCRQIRSNPAFARILGQPMPAGTSLSSSPFEPQPNFRVLQDGRELRPEELPMKRAAAGNCPVRDFEQTIARDDGVMLEVIEDAVPIRDDTGAVRGCVATLQDITARKRAERQRLEFERKLLQSQKLESIGVLAGGIAHDFNNLLTGVLGHASFARVELARGSTAIDPLLAQVELSAQRAAELCRQLLAYAGKGRFVVRSIDLNVAIEQAVPLLRLSMAKKIRLDLQLGANLPPFRGDPNQISQALMNLVTNAAEAIGIGVGVVTIRTDRANLAAMDVVTLNAAPDMEPGAFVCLEVRDDGCGIPPEALGHIFEPFFTTKFVGRGLGLSAVLGIVQGHRGGIRVTSHPGLGSTFELFFPVMAVTPRTNPPIPLPPTSPVQGTVLVVDDDESIRAFASTALRACGFSVVTANDGEDALAKLGQAPTNYDAVLLDLSMPRMDGKDTLMALRMLAPSLPVILTSGHGEEGVAERFVGPGTADFLAKPFVADVLVDAISRAIMRAQAAS